MRAADLPGQFHFFGGHAREVAAPFVGADEEVVAEHVQLLLGLALHVGGAAAACIGVVAQDAPEFAKGDRTRDGLAGQRHVEDQRVEITAGIGEAAAFFDEELGEGAAS